MGFSGVRLARLREVLSRYVDSGTMPGLVAAVSRRGETRIEALGAREFGGEPMRRDAIFRIASMTKPITAAAVLILVEECELRLDDPVDQLLPELADRRVLTRLDGPLTETVPANRPITPRDLLTFRFGLGYVPGEPPIFQALAEAGLAPGPGNSELSVAEWMRRLGELPLAHQPGERWLYSTGSDVLGVLVERASGRPFAEFLRERIFEPLGMRDTGFHVPADQAHRLAASYESDASGAPVPRDDPRDAQPGFPAGGSGLVSTVDDYLAFYRMLLNGGRNGAHRILSRASVELMRTDQLTEQQKLTAQPLLDADVGWAFGHAVITRRTGLSTPGTQTWSGGLGTTAFADPAEDLVGVLLTQRAMDESGYPNCFKDFTTTAYQALGD
ncbi:CubicO group peptidase, beta-lactamase class C family [Saccharopolyspora antimicrobica]|uniref:CubicO group peptidase (Beta-lactamase class C family) n=1 Tax=Saccharopolyspora antimicrobica TaxID=455193 RepID=A0A1I4Q830_9PSEU|nr:serine hydrolase domain-containing protein [Saccharopolyspora antimicrobica]RKT84817.1 CubicO group peptidase (beta-lactamase class C family) [Saccharopolyspora antimicrobica]SFM36248.1 CubicO group peptidase, beta-lactamase class C family [Saccharopolyspora antimicrobica]